jgi:hypothetical protein
VPLTATVRDSWTRVCDNGVDRISSIPDRILRNVVSCLPVKDATRTGALASRWHDPWRLMPAVFTDANLLDGCRADPLWRPGLEDTLGVTNEVSDILAVHLGPSVASRLPVATWT